ncbi:uncharacterized protein BXZ73DRAFT_87501 [Epithele typhae]|uniref:uncharacterized protein n=1 Tax=Epithele typhae TaxID=378194 RepID=UPI0020089AD6|nr:uncharacterized protein BXZ73DRAFT_87501 [Epithele typhae]KAH9943080.1 hypothetical protein BXZ73DRAFT_87501 [Epithele typhae]
MGCHNSPRPSAASPSPAFGLSQSRPVVTFDAELLKAYMKELLPTTLRTATWPEPRERDKVKAWMKEIGERVKKRMLEIQPRDFKYIVLTQINENAGQGGRADLVCHWEDSDAVAQEVFANDSIICICVAFAVRTI